MPKEQIDIHEVSEIIEKCYLHSLDKQNYVLELNQILLDVDTVRKYNMKKFNMEEDTKILVGHLRREDQ